MTEKKTKLERMMTYIEDGLTIAVHMKGDALMKDNMHAFASSQGAIDILLDLKSIHDGKEITTIAEMREDMEDAIKKAKEGADGTGTPYAY